MNKPPAPTLRKLDQEGFNRAATAVGMERVVFLAGPYITTGKAPRKGKKNIAAALRFHLFQEMTEMGTIVTLGEYERLTTAHHALLGDQNNSALAEIGHAKETADAIIMIPSSPGSFLELGAFSLYDDICRKMLVIVDSQYESHENYMNSGPIIGAKNNGATIRFINYEDHKTCVEEVQKFVQSQISIKAAKGYLPK